MKTLITGATGFLGATLARKLLEKGESVRGIRRPSSRLDLLGDLAPDVEWIEADVQDIDSLLTAMQGMDRVYHCAAYLGFNGQTVNADYERVNVCGTANVVDAALSSGIERLVHTSSIAALGRSEDESECLNESTEWRTSRMNTNYGVSKYRAELEVQRAIAEGLDAVIVNPSVIMGVGRPGENTMLLAEKIRDGKMPFLPAGSTGVVDVLDVVEGQVRAMESGKTGRRYILSGENLSWRMIASTLAGTFGVKPPKLILSPVLMLASATMVEFIGRLLHLSPLITKETARLASLVSCYDNSRARKELGIEFQSFAVTAGRIAGSIGNLPGSLQRSAAEG